MIMEAVLQAITTVGFPIVCAMLMGWFIYRIYTNSTQQNKENMEAVQARCAEREEKLYTIISEAQTTNERLLQTNAEFVSVLETYKTDLVEIKSDVAEIKNNMKG